MTNQPDIVQPRLRRSGKSGNTPAALAEQSTRVLIRVPKLATATIQAPVQSQFTQPQSVRLQPIQPQATPPAPIQPPALQPKSLTIETAPTPAISEPKHYSTTTQQLQGSAVQRPAAPASAPMVSRLAARIDAAHAATTGPHLAAPDWLNDKSRKSSNVVQTRLLLVVGAVAGFALGALTWHSHTTHAPANQNSASRNQSPAQGLHEKARPATQLTDTAAAESNAPAQVSQTAVATTNPKESAASTWDWNPKGAANAPASIEQENNRISENESANAAGATSPSDVQASDPSRAAWLQGTIDTVHSTPAPVQR